MNLHPHLTNSITLQYLEPLDVTSPYGPYTISAHFMTLQGPPLPHSPFTDQNSLPLLFHPHSKFLSLSCYFDHHRLAGTYPHVFLVFSVVLLQ